MHIGTAKFIYKDTYTLIIILMCYIYVPILIIRNSIAFFLTIKLKLTEKQENMRLFEASGIVNRR